MQSQNRPEPPEGLGPYRLDRLFGSGGMGAVWRAWDERLDRWVALKQIRAGAPLRHGRERLRREARAVARLSHPAIVHVYDILEGADGDWIVMEVRRYQSSYLVEARLAAGRTAEGLAAIREILVLPEGAWHRPRPGGPPVRAARGGEPGPPSGRPGPRGRGPAAAQGPLRDLPGGLRDRRSPGGARAPRPALPR